MLSENISINATNIRRDAYRHGHNDFILRENIVIVDIDAHIYQASLVLLR